MKSQDYIQDWLVEIHDQRQELHDRKTLLNNRKAELFMKIELLTKLRHQLKTDLLNIYKAELEKIQLEVKSLGDLEHDLVLLETSINKEEAQFVK